MKVICKQVTSRGFDLREVTTVFSNDFDYGFGGHGLQLEIEYLVMGILLYKDTNCLYYLVDINGRPDWFPYLLFSVSDKSIPQNWFINVNGRMSKSTIHSICGFYELCNDDNFYEQLAERDEQALRIYFKRKIEFEKLCSVPKGT